MHTITNVRRTFSGPQSPLYNSYLLSSEQTPGPDLRVKCVSGENEIARIQNRD